MTIPHPEIVWLTVDVATGAYTKEVLTIEHSNASVREVNRRTAQAVANNALLAPDSK